MLVMSQLCCQADLGACRYYAANDTIGIAFKRDLVKAWDWLLPFLLEDGIQVMLYNGASSTYLGWNFAEFKHVTGVHSIL